MSLSAKYTTTFCQTPKVEHEFEPNLVDFSQYEMEKERMPHFFK